VYLTTEHCLPGLRCICKISHVDGVSVFVGRKHCRSAARSLVTEPQEVPSLRVALKGGAHSSCADENDS
jgi:hypothetical protein